MALFQKVIVKKYLKNLSSDLIDENYKKYSEHFNDFAMAERVKVLKEEQYQEGFLRDLFVNCLGYTINPYENFNLTTEFKNKTDAEKADGAILKDGKPIAVIELKSTKTKDLKTIEKQAFNYKAHQVNCKYVITSNFEKIRLYINDATEFEEFNVFQLSRDEFNFLYLCFSKDSIFEDVPSIIKEKSNQHEEQISKKLYKDYSDFRNKIFQNLTKNNPQIDKLILFKKSQKLLDRFLFIFFAEDKGLIPANMISKIIEDYNKLKEMDHYTPLYSEFKRFFSYINQGNKKYNIDAYNGGLFQFDEILDNVIIDDEILITDSLKLSNYDFDSEIDVNILGHIFEHSLTDIEKLNAEISGENLVKKQTRRKKEGVFYTPNYITKYIVENTVGTLCTEKKNELKLNNLEIDKTYFKKTRNSLSKKGKQLFDKLENYKEWLLSLKILDPACGSGAFLNQALNFLINEHNFIIDLETDLRKGQLSLFDIDTAVLENNLYGVDINEESVEIAKLSLWLKTAKKERKLTDLSEHIKCGNSLIEDPEIAGEKAFDWNKEFPEIMQNGGFDVVIGNPPYGAKFSKNETEYFSNKFIHQSYQLDSFLLFTEMIKNWLKEGGFAGYIMPNTWLSSLFGSKIRKYILYNFRLKCLVHYNFFVFNDATVETDTYILQNSKPNGNSLINFTTIEKDKLELKKQIMQEEWIILKGKPINIYETENARKIKQKLSNLKTLGNIVQIVQGTKPFQIGKGKPKQTQETLKLKPFVSETKKDDTFLPLIRGNLISKYSIQWKNNYWISYGDWLAEPRYSAKFESKEKLLIRQTGDSLIVAYDDQQFVARDNLYIIRDGSHKLDMKGLLAILNSRFLNWYFQNLINPERGKAMAQVKRGHLQNLPIITANLNNLSKNSDIMLSLNKQKQEKINTFLHRLETSFEIEKLSNKLKAFFNYDFKTLISELKKQKIKLTLPQQDEWEEYFNNYKEEINELQKQIFKTDKEIDQMVYELYSLTKEEIEIVEKG